jgi:hypothetical protein
MDKKIIAIMVSLLVIAGVVVAFVVIAAGGGLRSAGGFTNLYDKLEYTSWATPGNQYLQLPESWDDGDEKKVSDVIVDMTYEKRVIAQTSVYITELWFVYLSDKWSAPFESDGSQFFVPVDWPSRSWLEVENGMFSITVSSATNLSAKYTIGDVITLQCELDTNINDMLAFGEWEFSEPF